MQRELHRSTGNRVPPWHFPPPPSLPLAALKPAFAVWQFSILHALLLPQLPSCVHHPFSCSMQSVLDLLAALPAQFRHVAPTAAAVGRAHQLAHELSIARQQAHELFLARQQVGLSGSHGTQDAHVER